MHDLQLAEQQHNCVVHKLDLGRRKLICQELCKCGTDDQHGCKDLEHHFYSIRLEVEVRLSYPPNICDTRRLKRAI
jgi:hypothetical protein